ncbi:MAG TPA: SPFH domain-containing protein [Kofleriaceae bacterium]|nr:SPFH domain-containing protein [Kofleriaceae bacterium]
MNAIDAAAASTAHRGSPWCAVVEATRARGLGDVSEARVAAAVVLDQPELAHPRRVHEDAARRERNELAPGRHVPAASIAVDGAVASASWPTRRLTSEGFPTPDAPTRPTVRPGPMWSGSASTNKGACMAVTAMAKYEREIEGWRAGRPVEDPAKTKRWGFVTAKSSELLVHCRRGRVLDSSGQGATGFKWRWDSVAVVPTSFQKVRFGAVSITLERVGVSISGLAVYRIVEPLLAFWVLSFSYPERAQEKLEQTLTEMLMGVTRRLVANLTVDECRRRRSLRSRSGAPRTTNTRRILPRPAHGHRRWRTRRRHRAINTAWPRTTGVGTDPRLIPIEGLLARDSGKRKRQSRAPTRP